MQNRVHTLLQNKAQTLPEKTHILLQSKPWTWNSTQTLLQNKVQFLLQSKAQALLQQSPNFAAKQSPSFAAAKPKLFCKAKFKLCCKTKPRFCCKAKPKLCCKAKFKICCRAKSNNNSFATMPSKNQHVSISHYSGGGQGIPKKTWTVEQPSWFNHCPPSSWLPAAALPSSCPSISIARTVGVGRNQAPGMDLMNKIFTYEVMPWGVQCCEALPERTGSCKARNLCKKCCEAFQAG